MFGIPISHEKIYQYFLDDKYQGNGDAGLKKLWDRILLSPNGKTVLVRFYWRMDVENKLIAPFQCTEGLNNHIGEMILKYEIRVLLEPLHKKSLIPQSLNKTNHTKSTGSRKSNKVINSGPILDQNGNGTLELP